VQAAQTWPCPLAAGGSAPELAVVFGTPRLLIVPALFDEGNKLRRFTIGVMRRLAAAGIGSVLPDLPGCGESLLPLESQSPSDWQHAMEGAARHFACSHVLAIRGGSLVAPRGLGGWHYAPVAGASQMRQMLRARILAAREASVEETQDGLLTLGREAGLELAGYRLGPEFIAEFGGLVAQPNDDIHTITQDLLTGSGLWLRAEPSEDAAQADALAAIVAIGMKQ
jgi:hypothetical protein